MEIVLWLLVLIILGIAVFGWRGLKAVHRLQVCIDRGIVELSNGAVEIPESLPEEEKLKLRKELKWYLAVGRSEIYGYSRGMQLHPKNSIR